jgi:circadian clock protein KaiC
MKTKIRPTYPGIAKCPTGIRGLDEITDGGLPQGWPTPGCSPTTLRD